MKSNLSKKLKGFSVGQVETLTKISARKIRWWDQIGLITPGESQGRKSGQRRRYTVQDIVCLLVVKALRDNGVSLQEIRDSINRIQMAGIDHPLAKLRFACLAHTIIVKKEGKYIEPISGQLVIEEALEIIRPKLPRKRTAPTERAVERAKIIYEKKLACF